MSGLWSLRQTWLGAILAQRLDAAGKRLFRDADAYAAAQGWTVRVKCGGLAREYRDPRFDLLACCQFCGGSGAADDRPCADCAGTGRITIGQSSVTPGKAT